MIGGPLIASIGFSLCFLVLFGNAGKELRAVYFFEEGELELDDLAD